MDNKIVGRTDSLSSELLLHAVRLTGYNIQFDSNSNTKYRAFCRNVLCSNYVLIILFYNSAGGGISYRTC